MDLKYTVEILTKDIQDIEKLVARLQNSDEASTLELDMAMTKLRNVYEVLGDIRADLADVRRGRISQASAAASEAHAPAPAEEPAGVPEPKAKTEAEPSAEPEVRVEPEASPEPEAKAEPEASPEPEATAEPEAIAEPETNAEHGNEDRAALQSRKRAEILAEKFISESSINENLAGSREQVVESKVVGKPIDNISRNIGINDRFLIIRELFDGDAEAFGKLVAELDQAGDRGAALALLRKAMEHEPDHEGAGILSNLVKRRYS